MPTSDDLQRQIDDVKNRKDPLVTPKQPVDATVAPGGTAGLQWGDAKAPFTGAVGKDKVGTQEAALLASKAVKDLASKIADAIFDFGNVFLVLSGTTFPKLQRLFDFRIRKSLIVDMFAAVGVTSQAAPGPAVGNEAMRSERIMPLSVTAGLDGLSKFLSFFKTDFDVGSIETKIDESLLIAAIANSLLQPRNTKATKTVRLLAMLGIDGQNESLDLLKIELTVVSALHGQAFFRLNELSQQIIDVQQVAVDAANPKYVESQSIVKNLQLQVDAVKDAIALSDAFTAWLATVDAATGASMIGQIASDLTTESILKPGGLALLVHIENSGGGYLVKKNLWTGLFGDMPLYHSGGATVSYILVNGATGKILRADVIGSYNGYIKSREIRAGFNF